MLTVPTTPRLFDPGLPDQGGWTGVCLHLATQLRTPGSARGFEAIAGITEGVQSRSIRCPASINP
jgi:hypothetical protein